VAFFEVAFPITRSSDHPMSAALYDADFKPAELISRVVIPGHTTLLSTLLERMPVETKPKCCAGWGFGRLFV
jgi:hypothetical protein